MTTLKMNMNKRTVASFRARGFTLIELLIVIAVIGILAVAVLSAINPIEQIRKATDAGKKSDSAELLNAAERYYTTFQEDPWTAVGVTGAPVNGSATAMASNNAGLVELNTKGELKPEFLARTNLPKLFTSIDSTGLLHVCFLPESKTVQAQAQKTQTGTDNAANCATWTNQCYVCYPQ